MLKANSWQMFRLLVMVHDKYMVALCAATYGVGVGGTERGARTDMDSLLLSLESGITRQTNAYAYLDVLRAKPALRKIYELRLLSSCFVQN